MGLAAVIKDLTSKGLYLSIPINEDAPFDLVACDRGKCYRVQVKTRSSSNGAVEVRFRSCWADKNGVHYSEYADEDFDVLAIYAIDEDKCLYFSNGGEKCVTIRFEPPRNNQASGVRMWVDYQSFPPSETIRGAPTDRFSVHGEEIVQPASQEKAVTET